MRLSFRVGKYGWMRGVAALLLALQASAGGVIALAHAADSGPGPASLESQHTAQCVMLHDAARCAQCQYQACRMVPASTRRDPLPAGPARRVGSSERLPQAVWRPLAPTDQPRAPPPTLS